MAKWLVNILRDGTLVDNQNYKVNNCALTNNRISEPILLNKKQPREWGGIHNNEDAIWKFLNTINREIQEVLLEKSNSALVLFNNGDYEHNTDDNFINLSGIDCMNFTLTTGNLIGYIKKGDYSLKISSRFGDKFLKYIISDADGFIEIEDKGGISKDEGYEWLLIYLWKTKLKKSFRLGLPKNYVTKNEHLNSVKGNINVIDYFSPINEGKYKCTYREHSYNNSVTQLISTTFKKIGNHEFLNGTNLIKNAFYTATDGIRYRRSDLYNTKHFSNPFYSEYNEVIDLSKLILRDELSDFGEKSNNSAFFFDISMLFEYFIRKLLKRNGFVLESKFEKRLEIPSGVNHFQRKIEPDIVFHLQGNTYVFDVKYKTFDFRYGVNREDIFQLHTYIGQYGNISNVKACGFIYPISQVNWEKMGLETKDGVIQNKINVMGKLIEFYVILIKIPSDHEANFRELFNKSCECFINIFQQKILK